MPAFDVTTNPTTLQPLKPGDKATIVVTATSRLARPVTARANKVVDPKVFDAFVKPPANVQRTFNQSGATQEFPFTVEIAADAKAGSGTVRFDVVDVDQPDDNFGQSSALKLVIQEPPVVAPPPKPKVPWWVWLIAGVVLIGIGIVIWRVSVGGKGKMPDVVAMTFADAKAAIGIDSSRITRVDTLDADTAAWHGDVVIRQSPPKGTSLKPDTTKVRLVVQKPYAVVPAVMNLEAARAGAMIGVAGFTLGLAYSCQTPASPQDGRVIGVAPPQGTLQPRAATVTIRILSVQPAGCGIIHLDTMRIKEEYQRYRVRVPVPPSSTMILKPSP